MRMYGHTIAPGCDLGTWDSDAHLSVEYSET